MACSPVFSGFYVAGILAVEFRLHRSVRSDVMNEMAKDVWKMKTEGREKRQRHRVRGRDMVEAWKRMVGDVGPTGVSRKAQSKVRHSEQN